MPDVATIDENLDDDHDDDHTHNDALEDSAMEIICESPMISSSSSNLFDVDVMHNLTDTPMAIYDVFEGGPDEHSVIKMFQVIDIPYE